MEAIIEILFTLAAEIVKGAKFKRPKTRTRAMTVIFVLFFGMVTAVSTFGAVSLFQEGNTSGSIITGVFALACAVVGAIVIIRGHKSNWKNY